jgi:hypothetical protein
VVAALYGHDLVPRQLWKYNQYYNMSIIPYEAINDALYQATDAQHETAIAFLLDEYRASPDTLGAEYGSALTASAFDGTTSILLRLP